MLRKGDVAEGIVKEVQYPNRGIIEGPEGERVIVKNVVPGQKIEYQIYKRRPERMFGHFRRTVERAAFETEPECPSFPECGGCVYHTVPYEEQLKIKAGQIQELLKDVVSPDTVFDGIIPSPDASRYRNKMEFSFGDEFKGGPLRLGLHRRSAMYDILDASECTLVHSDFNLITACVRDYCTEKELPYYHKNIHKGYLRHLLVRRGERTGEILILIVTSSQLDHDFTELGERLRMLGTEGSIVGFIHGINDKLADMVQVEEQKVIFGRDHYYDELMGLRFKVSMFSFFQTNTSGAEKLYEKVREYALMCVNDGLSQKRGNSAPVIYDLYCGTGTIAQVMAPVAKKVYGIELVEEAVEAARVNAELNGIENCVFLAGDVGKVIPDIGEKPDLVIVDPPREGILPKSLEKIRSFDIDRMIYISCKASSFAENMELLAKDGWKIERYAVTDLFPMTVHVETVVLMSRK